MKICDEKHILEQREEMETTLISAGLPKNLIGRQYFFAAEWGSHHQEMMGTIKAIETSDEGPLLLVVSNRRFWGEKLIGLAFVEKNWCAYIDVKEVHGRFISGQLMLL